MTWHAFMTGMQSSQMHFTFSLEPSPLSKTPDQFQFKFRNHNGFFPFFFWFPWMGGWVGGVIYVSVCMFSTYVVRHTYTCLNIHVEVSWCRDSSSIILEPYSSRQSLSKKKKKNPVDGKDRSAIVSTLFFQRIRGRFLTVWIVAPIWNSSQPLRTVAPRDLLEFSGLYE